MDPRELLVDLMDTDFGLLDKLLACETLTRREMNEIKDVRSRYDRNKMLLEYIDKKGSHEQFKTALSETRQKHLVNYLDSNGVYSSEFGDDWPLTGNELKVLDANQDTLVELLDPNELINLLVGKKIINYRQLKVINSKSNEFRRNELLIEIFRRGSRHDYQKIVQCLRLSNQEHIADILQFGGVVVQVHADLGEDNESEAKIVSSFRRFLRSKSPQEQQRIIDLVQLQNDDMQLIELSPSNSIGLFFHCRTSKGLDNLYEMVTSGRLKEIVEITFMKVLQPSKTLTIVTEIRLEENQYQRCKKYFEDISAASNEDFSEMIDPEENVDISRRLITRDVAGLTVCSICNNPFTKPRSLPCFHRFCLQCLEEEFAHKRKPGNKIACPNCAQIVKVPVDGIASLPRNLFLDKLLQASGTADEELYSHRACDKCKENDEDKPDDNAGLATMHCIECKQNLCENCYREHRRHRPSRSHSVVELRSRENAGCKEHPENVAVKYCSDSESFICTDCACFEDKDEQHKHIDVKQMMEESRRIIETVKDEVLDLLDETYSYDLRQMLLDSISETESNIVAKCDEMKKAVESDKLELLQKLDLIKGKRLREIKTEQDAIESHRSDLQWFISIVEELKEKGSPSDLTDARIGVSAEVAVLQDNHRSLRKRVEEEEVSCYVELSLINIGDQLKDKKQNCIGTIKVGSNTKKVRDSDNAYYYSPDSLVDEEYSTPLQANVEKVLTRGESVSAVSESAISFTAADSQNPESQPEMSAARIPRVIPRAIPRVIPRKTVTAPASLNSQLPEAQYSELPEDNIYDEEESKEEPGGECSEEIYKPPIPPRKYGARSLSAESPASSVQSRGRLSIDKESMYSGLAESYKSERSQSDEEAGYERPDCDYNPPIPFRSVPKWLTYKGNVTTMDSGVSGVYTSEGTPSEVASDPEQEEHSRTEPPPLRRSLPDRHAPSIGTGPGLAGVREFKPRVIRIQLILRYGSTKYTEICSGSIDNLADVLVKRYSEESKAEPVVRKWCDFFREAEVLNRLQHPNIIKLLGVSRTEPHYVVFQLTGKTFLSSFLKKDNGTKIKLKETIKIATQIADAMSYLEKKKCIHRLLAAQNILIGDSLLVKVANFEMAIFVDEVGKHGTFSDHYELLESPIKIQSPEVILWKKWSTKSDVWSFGIVLYEILTNGAAPYPGMTDEELASAVRTTDTSPSPAGKKEFSEKRLDTIMRCCWHKKPDRRPTFEYLLKFFREYFTQGDRENKMRFLPRPDLLKSIEGSGPVRGITLHDGLLYVVRSSSRNIELYDAFKLKRKSKTICVDGEQSKMHVLKDRLSIHHGSKAHQSGLQDVASCPNINCIYVSDLRDSCIHRLDVVTGKLLESWPVQEPFCLSVTKYGNLMISCRNSAKLYEYTPSGELAHFIDIGGNGEGPVHGIQIGEDFVVCHGDADVNHCREFVCIYDIYNVKPDYAQRVELQKPSYLVVDSNDQILVAETGRERIVLLSPSLDSLTVLLTPDHGLSAPPTRICLDERRGRLFVGLENGSLLVFRVKLDEGRPIQHSVSTYFETSGDGVDDDDYYTLDETALGSNIV